MLRPSRILKFGLLLLGLAIVRAFAFPFIDPANKLDPGFWSQVYNFSILLWMPAMALISVAGMLQIALSIIAQARRR